MIGSVSKVPERSANYLRRDTDTLEVPMPTHPTPTDRFWSKVNKTDTCWLWTGRKNNHGYGVFFENKRHVYAHRFSYGLRNGDVPSGLVLDHLCRTPLCVRPEHLEAVTQQVNLQRGEGLIGLHARATHCIHGHEFTEENTILLKRGGRQCRECQRARDRKRGWRFVEVFQRGVALAVYSATHDSCVILSLSSRVQRPARKYDAD